MSKIGYLHPSIRPGTLVWPPWMSRKVRNLILILTRHYFLLSFLKIPVILSFTTFRDSKFYILYVIRFLKTLPIDFPMHNSSIISDNLRIVNLSARKQRKMIYANVVKLRINSTLDKTDDNEIKKVDFNDLADTGGPSQTIEVMNHVQECSFFKKLVLCDVQGGRKRLFK